jgi:hypothetical protein
MVQDDSYYLSLGYEYARQRKELDILEEERQALLAQAVRVKIETEKADKVLEEANRVSEQHKKIVRAIKAAYYRDKHEHDHDNDRLEFTSEGKYIWSIYAIPSEIQHLIDDDKISPEEFKKMDIVHKTKWGE